ncbi:MAG: hypothetical protein AB1894_19950 [Chloroflexota bacterium]
MRCMVSPDGHWLAFYSGSMEAPYDLTLNVMSIPDGIVWPVTRLFSSDYPEVLSVVVEWLSPQLEYPLDLESLQLYFPDAMMRALAWSPDGSSLAFAGQMDGPSSDLYIYEVETGQIRRLTDDLQILYGISWSPDGKWLMIVNMLPDNYTVKTLHRIRANGNLVSNPAALEKGAFWAGVEWIAPNLYLVSGAPDGGELFGLRSWNVETGQRKDIWTSTYFGFAIDPERQLIAISGEPRDDIEWDSQEYAFYFATYDGRKQKISDDIFWEIVFRGGLASNFIGLDGKYIVTIALDGTLANMGIGPNKQISVSPNRQWFLLYGGEARLYSATDQPVRTFGDLKISGALWWRDSSGLVVTTGRELYTITVPDGVPVLIDSCQSLEKYCGFEAENMLWIP